MKSIESCMSTGKYECTVPAQPIGEQSCIRAGGGEGWVTWNTHSEPQTHSSPGQTGWLSPMYSVTPQHFAGRVSSDVREDVLTQRRLTVWGRREKGDKDPLTPLHKHAQCTHAVKRWSCSSIFHLASSLHEWLRGRGVSSGGSLSQSDEGLCASSG